MAGVRGRGHAQAPRARGSNWKTRRAASLDLVVSFFHSLVLAVCLVFVCLSQLRGVDMMSELFFFIPFSFFFKEGGGEGVSAGG